MHDPAALVASAFVEAAAREGLTPDPALRLLAWTTPRSTAEVPVPGDPFELGPLHEQLVVGDERVRRGAWYTPRWLAEDLVGRAFDAADRAIGVVADPSCGGGVFMLAAAERLTADRPPRAAVEALWGYDVDPVAVAVTEAALWWWSARRGQPTLPVQVVVRDALTATRLPPVDVVVGNPPFLGQLRSRTAADEHRRAALQERFGAAVRPYTDAAWLFLIAAVDAVEAGGAVSLVQPSSLLGARDAGVVRRCLDERASVIHTWIDDGSAFAAAVEACAPVLRVGTPATNDWTAPLAISRGVPEVDLQETSTLGDVASVSAGFRDEYYGLVDAVREGGAGPRLVTCGAIDPLRHRTDVTTRFAKRRWAEPAIDTDHLTGRAARWVEDQSVPKLLVATQTRVVEAIADPDGALVGSVPVVVVTPDDPADLWHLAAILHAPSISAWMLRRSAGTALSNDACKPTAALLSAVPLPVDDDAWHEAAALARTVADGADRWEQLAAVADRAYGIDDPSVRSWWLGRLPVR